MASAEKPAVSTMIISCVQRAGWVLESKNGKGRRASNHSLNHETGCIFIEWLLKRSNMSMEEGENDFTLEGRKDRF